MRAQLHKAMLDLDPATQQPRGFVELCQFGSAGLPITPSTSLLLILFSAVLFSVVSGPAPEFLELAHWWRGVRDLELPVEQSEWMEFVNVFVRGLPSAATLVTTLQQRQCLTCLDPSHAAQGMDSVCVRACVVCSCVSVCACVRGNGIFCRNSTKDKAVARTGPEKLIANDVHGSKENILSCDLPGSFGHARRISQKNDSEACLEFSIFFDIQDNPQPKLKRFENENHKEAT